MYTDLVCFHLKVRGEIDKVLGPMILMRDLSTPIIS